MEADDMGDVGEGAWGDDDLGLDDEEGGDGDGFKSADEDAGGEGGGKIIKAFLQFKLNFLGFTRSFIDKGTRNPVDN